MISYEEALEKVLGALPRLEEESVSLDDLAGRCLAKPLRTALDLPVFDASAVDGYAVKMTDAKNASDTNPVRLRVAAEVHAGSTASLRLDTGTTQRVMTGAPIPAGTEAIVMREHTRESSEHINLLRGVIRGENIRRRGEEFRKGDIVLPEGSVLTPAGIALTASLGVQEAVVVRQPRIAVVTTGNEARPPGTPLKAGEIYNSNLWGLRAALAEDRFTAVMSRHIADSLTTTAAVFKQAGGVADVVITTGGVSMGDSDFVKIALEDFGAEILFDRVAVKPGKPMCFARLKHKEESRETFFFCCPGNPVSVLLSYHFFVRPALCKLMGHANTTPLRLTAVLNGDLRKKGGRRENLRGRLVSDNGNLIVTPMRAQGSHMLGGLATANCLIHFPLEADSLKAGTTVEVEPLSLTY